ncbi:phospholipase D-like domain-containing protein [Archangium lansingense]|uniref:phospholipase D-like domain-containing protein n=1 Tax=Archangium lansingense TaxID=2995310 RepID=UPI003B7C44D3
MNRFPRILLACLLGTACIHRDYPQALRVHEDLPGSGPEFSLALYQSVGVGLRSGHSVALVQDARILETFEAEIRQARESIHLLISRWQPGEPSERLLRALAERQPGVVCRLLVDPIQSPGFEDTVGPRLVQAGCDVRSFRPFVGAVVVFDDERLEARNHRQLVIRDGRSGLTGGTGVGPAWRDTHVHVEGPAVRQLQQAFARDWLEAGGGLLPESAFPTLEPRGEARAGFIASTGSPSLSHSERMVQVLMAAARRRLWLTNACFVPTAATVDTLIRKARAGVDVRILVPGDEATAGVLAAQRSTYERLLESGVRLWEYRSAPLHARTLVVDEQLAAVGSNNLEPNASALLEEGALVVEDAPLATALADSFERDLSHAVEVRRDEWRERGWLDRFGSPLPASAAGCR